MTSVFHYLFRRGLRWKVSWNHRHNPAHKATLEVVTREFGSDDAGYLAPSSQGAALQHVLRYYERENGHWDQIKEAEVQISLVKDHYILRGNVDLVRGENNTVEIVDFKSEKKPDMERDRDRLAQ